MAKTKNMKIEGLVNMIDMYMKEILECPSSGVTAILKPDMDRILAFLKSFTNYFGYVTDAKDPNSEDFPKSHNNDHYYDVADAVEFRSAKNLAIVDILRTLEALRVEFLECQSSDLKATVLPADITRFRAIITDMNKFVDEYVMTTLPIDAAEADTKSSSVSK